MITHRPKTLLNDKNYRTLPKLPIAIDWSSIPELIRLMTLDLSGIQPITKAMSDAAGGTLEDKPSEGEVELFRKRATKFQLVSVVLSTVAAGEVDGVVQVKPFAMSLIPASKRNEVQHQTIEWVKAADLGPWLATKPMYAGFDPFQGQWSLYGQLPNYLDGEREGFLDEIGIVIDQFHLATETKDDDILMIDLKMPTEEMKKKYEKYRNNLLFRPFRRVETRPVWGVETAIELFMVQGLAKEGLFPEAQTLIMDDGTTFPSLVHLWQDMEFRHTDRLITSVDLYFPSERVAVFCDGTTHARGKRKERDDAIDSQLESVGIKPVRLPSKEIKIDLAEAIVRVKDALTGESKPIAEAPQQSQAG